MNEPSKSDPLLTELKQERSIRRTVKLLRLKRSRILEDLNQLVTHLSLLVPMSQPEQEGKSRSDLLIEAAYRLDDDVFAELLVQIIQQQKS